MKVGPDEKSISSNERAGSDFRLWICAVSQTMCSEEHLVPNENQKIGNSGLGAAFVTGTLRFLKNCNPKKRWSIRKIRKWERAGW